MGAPKLNLAKDPSLREATLRGKLAWEATIGNWRKRSLSPNSTNQPLYFTLKLRSLRAVPLESAILTVQSPASATIL